MSVNLKNVFDISNRVAVVTGAAGLLGGQYVRALLLAGAKVVALDSNLENPRGNLKAIGSSKLLKVQVDITNKTSIADGLKEIVKRFGHPQILVNNAAIDAPVSKDKGPYTGDFENYPHEAWDAMMEVNLKGMFLCCQIIGGDMAKQKKGSIINISSIYGMLSPDQRIYIDKTKKERFIKPVTYSVTKSGVLNLTRYLATYWADQNVRVNTMTLAGVFDQHEGAFLRNYCAKVPLGRMARRDEYNGALVFLSSDASSYMTGSNLVIDGGYTSW